MKLNISQKDLDDLYKLSLGFFVFGIIGLILFIITGFDSSVLPDKIINKIVKYILIDLFIIGSLGILILSEKKEFKIEKKM